MRFGQKYSANQCRVLFGQIRVPGNETWLFSPLVPVKKMVLIKLSVWVWV